MIRPSPLRLKQYFVEELRFQVHELPPDVAKSMPELMPADIEFKVDGFENTAQPNDMLCRLTVGLRKTEKLLPYDFKLRMVGFFEIAAGLTPEQQEAQRRFGMVSVLWGVAREVLADAMRKGPYPPLMLPVVTFVPDEARDPKKGAESAVEAKQVP